jgi:hypothetical protein
LTPFQGSDDEPCQAAVTAYKEYLILELKIKTELAAHAGNLSKGNLNLILFKPFFWS